jgi:crotonobetainyl-CoA:carnitine CoA-transferase CaiB-like acyl-CoA transferase
MSTAMSDSTAQPATPAKGPLDGLVVLDLTRVLSGPYCTMMLADLGARVIKIEQPGRGDDTRAWGPPFAGSESAYFLSINRNKESVTLNLKNERGRDLVTRLLERADVLIENFRPGAMARLGLDYNQVSSRWPRLVYCSISGFGQAGPRRDEPGYDAVAQAEGGLMNITGPGDGPPFRLGVAVADIVTGMFAAQGITAALLARERTGRGQFVDIAMLDSTVALLTYQASSYFATGISPVRMGNRHPSIVPYENFAASDGDFMLSVGNDAIWQSFCRVTGLDDLAHDPRFVTNAARVEHYDDLKPVLDERLRTRPRHEWIAALLAAGVPCGAVRNAGEVLSDPQLEHRDMIASVEHATQGRLKVLGSPLKLSATPSSVREAPPTLGQHTESVLSRDLGLSRQEIEGLRAAGVI